MKITTEPQQIYVEAFDTKLNLGTVWLNERGIICFTAASNQSDYRTFPGGILYFIKYIRLERDKIKKQLTIVGNKISR